MKRKINKNLAPVDAKTFKQICELPRDNDSYGNFWWIIDEGTITLSNQKIGEEPTERITLRRHVFEKLVRWYLTGSKAKASHE